MADRIREVTLIWDFDNTLAYREGMWGTSVYNALIDKGYVQFPKNQILALFESGFLWHRHEEAHKSYFGGSDWWHYLYGLIESAMEGIGIESAEAKRIAVETKIEYLNLEKWHLYEDTKEALQISVQKGYRNIILSNHTPELSSLVEGLGIIKYFETVFTSAVIGFEKPHPQIYQSLIDYIGYSKGVYMIGDSYEADVSGSLKAGLKAIWVRKENSMNYLEYSKDLSGIWKYIE